MIEIIQDLSFNKIEMINHGFFTRHGGISEGQYSSLNCAYASPDFPEKVRENRRRAMSSLNYGLEQLITVKNVHGINVVVVEKPWTEEDKPEADAMVTTLPHLVLGSDSADCPIVLFADDIAGTIGLAHAGWRGARGGVIEATVNKMVSLGARPEHINVAISPCIAQASYEVSLSFYENFLSDDGLNSSYFKPGNREGHFLFDLLGFVKGRLIKLNVKSISAEAAFDTYTDSRFFSCRRSMHRGESDFGGHLSFISMKTYSKK